MAIQHLLGVILNSKITNKKHKDVENMVLNKPHIRQVLTMWELKQEDSITSLNLTWNRHIEQLKTFTTLHVSMINHDISVSIDLGLQIAFRGQVN